MKDARSGFRKAAAVAGIAALLVGATWLAARRATRELGAAAERGPATIDAPARIDESPGVSQIESPAASPRAPLEGEGPVTGTRAPESTPNGPISGRVLWPDGTPASGVAVRAELDPFVLGDLTSTGAEGDFELALHDEGPFRIVAEADAPGEGGGKTAGTVERFTASAPGIAPGTTGLRLVLDRGFVLAGTVRDDLGAPLEAFTVQAIPFGRGREVSRSFHDADGVFELGGLAPGTWVLVAHAPDHGKGERIERTLPANTSSLALVRPRAGEIRGVVLGPDGAPVRSAEVLLDGGALPRPRRARTDADGRFAFERASAGPCRVVAWSETLPESEPLELELHAGETVSDVVLRLPAR